MPDKLTDNEIKKALELCLKNKCDKCPFNLSEVCQIDLMKLLFDLINRQKAENERLEKENQLMLDNHPANTHRNCVVIDNGVIYTKTLEDYEKFLTDVSAEAYKEFAERLKEYIDTYEHLACEECECVPISKDGLDDLLKELVGETK